MRLVDVAEVRGQAGQVGVGMGERGRGGLQPVERAVAAGATLREPVATFVSGDRYGSVVDPFGVRWTVMTRVEDLSPEESARRVAAWAAEQG
ncbi:hypothetical protein Cpa01nite_07070 [Cellulomonas pakistanensis]|uniref:Glyoxalase-like domain-containing protein n=1 Tax=Cellulomonas pakistanensis TaxID=992287 RepID=A0A919P9B4_9CELL|nr:hypothetical protein Cpa01nite_07070 [Cellulomonas pakistanensis]